MPYSSIAELPSAVRGKLKGKKLRQWMHVWNSAYERHGDESRAFAEAWATVRKLGDAAKGAKASKDEADYQAFPKGKQHCEICTMFRAPDSCTAVSGTIAPEGWCKFYEARSASALGKAKTMNGEFHVFMPIAKVDKEKRTVSGYASTPTKDSDGEVVTLDAIRSALPDYMSYGNIREMHALKAVGVAKEANLDSKGLFLTAKIVDDSAWKKCLEGVYKGFSIGGRKLDKEGDEITEIELTEISVVDRPANPDCRITIAKSAKAMENAEGHLLKIKEKKTAEQKAIAKLAKVVGDLAKAGPPAAHDGFSLPAKTAAVENASPKDDETQNNKADGEDATKREFSEDKRTELAGSGKALPDGSFSIENVEDLKNAIRAIGRAKDPAKAKAHIKARAKALNAESELPEDWGGGEKKPKKSKTAKKLAKKMEKRRLEKALGLNSESFLHLRKTEAAPVSEPIEKGMNAAGSLAYCFDSIRNVQRSLMTEAKREGGDQKDKALASELGTIAKQLATIISQKASHEGEEATTLTDADDQYLSSIFGEDELKMAANTNNTLAAVATSGDPLTDAIAQLMKRAATPTRAARMTMAKEDAGKARKAMKECRKAVEDVHKMLKASYLNKAKKTDGKDKPDADGDFDTAKAMEKMQKAYSEIEKARTFAKAAIGNIEKAESRSGQRGQEVGDAEAGFYEVPPGVKDLTPAAMAGAAPGTSGGASQPPAYPVDGSVYPGKAAGLGDLAKFARNGVIPAEVAELVMAKAKAEGELEALRRMPSAGMGGRRPYAFDMTKVTAGTGGGTDLGTMNKALFDGVDPNALNGSDERAHTEASAKVIGNLLTSGHFGKSILDPAFRGMAGSK